MHLRNVIFIFFVLLKSAVGQYSEISLSLGISNYLGDLVSPQEYFLGTNPAFAAYYQYNFTDRISVKAHLLWGQISGNDQNSSYDSGRRQRNLNFHSHILELSILGQIKPVGLPPFQKKTSRQPLYFLGNCRLSLQPFYYLPKQENFSAGVGHRRTRHRWISTQVQYLRSGDSFWTRSKIFSKQAF